MIYLFYQGLQSHFSIPAHLAYGVRGAGSVIPPDTDLIFELEMVGIQE
jgi:peptidylprolyl isomerase